MCRTRETNFFDQHYLIWKIDWRSRLFQCRSRSQKPVMKMSRRIPWRRLHFSSSFSPGIIVWKGTRCLSQRANIRWSSAVAALFRVSCKRWRRRETWKKPTNKTGKYEGCVRRCAYHVWEKRNREGGIYSSTQYTARKRNSNDPEEWRRQWPRPQEARVASRKLEVRLPGRTPVPLQVWCTP